MEKGCDPGGFSPKGFLWMRIITVIEIFESFFQKIEIGFLLVQKIHFCFLTVLHFFSVNIVFWIVS